MKRAIGWTLAVLVSGLAPAAWVRIGTGKETPQAWVTTSGNVHRPCTARMAPAASATPPDGMKRAMPAIWDGLEEASEFGRHWY